MFKKQQEIHNVCVFSLFYSFVIHSSFSKQLQMSDFSPEYCRPFMVLALFSVLKSILHRESRSERDPFQSELISNEHNSTKAQTRTELQPAGRPRRLTGAALCVRQRERVWRGTLHHSPTPFSSCAQTSIWTSTRTGGASATLVRRRSR